MRKSPKELLKPGKQCVKKLQKQNAKGLKTYEKSQKKLLRTCEKFLPKLQKCVKFRRKSLVENSAKNRIKVC